MKTRKFAIFVRTMLNLRESFLDLTQEKLENHCSNDLPAVDNYSNKIETNYVERRSVRKKSSFHRFESKNSVPDTVLLKVYSYLSTIDLIRCTEVCRRWYWLISRNSNLWRRLYLRPESNGSSNVAIQIRNVDGFVHALSTRFNTSLVCIDLPIELITSEILRELANRCPNLEFLTLDFSSAMQLHDFSDLQEFPCNLKSLCICLSEVIFLESFMRRIYSFLSSLRILQIIGTLEKSVSSNVSHDENDDYETINITRIKSSMPNLRVIHFYGISFLHDCHVETIASGCIHLECLALNFCFKIVGSSMKTLINRCRKLKCLLLQNTGSN